MATTVVKDIKGFIAECESALSQINALIQGLLEERAGFEARLNELLDGSDLPIEQDLTDYRRMCNSHLEAGQAAVEQAKAVCIDYSETRV